MCFSANASFAASGVLALVGAASLRETKTARGRMYAAIPFIFAIQQLIEGFQWLADKPGQWSLGLAYVFLLIAVVLWPIYIPVSVYLVEPKPDRKQRLGLFIMLGAVISTYSLINLFINPIAVTGLACCHIEYALNMPFQTAIGASYAVATCGSMLFSSQTWIKAMGAAALVALIVTYLIAFAATVSVWCFFAALLSMLVFLHVRSVPGIGVIRKNFLKYHPRI